MSGAANLLEKWLEAVKDMETARLLIISGILVFVIAIAMVTRRGLRVRRCWQWLGIVVGLVFVALGIALELRGESKDGAKSSPPGVKPIEVMLDRNMTAAFLELSSVQGMEWEGGGNPRVEVFVENGAKDAPKSIPPIDLADGDGMPLRPLNNKYPVMVDQPGKLRCYVRLFHGMDKSDPREINLPSISWESIEAAWEEGGRTERPFQLEPFSEIARSEKFDVQVRGSFVVYPESIGK